MLGESMEAQRKKIQMSRQALADRLNVTVGTVFRWEKNQRTPSDKDKERIANILGTSVAYLMGETDVSEPQHTKTTKSETSPTSNKDIQISLIVQGDESLLSEEERRHAKEHNIQYVERIPCNSFWPFMGTEEEAGKEAIILTKITTNPRKYAIAELIAHMDEEQLCKAYDFLSDQKQLAELKKRQGD
jgi:transcriptional regulator with XRE-family HTH domain